MADKDLTNIPPAVIPVILKVISHRRETANEGFQRENSQVPSDRRYG